MTEQRASFPMMPERWWWALREQFKKTIPQNVSARYLAAILEIAPDTATKIALPTFRKVGLIDHEGRPTDRVVKWRDDEQYSDVCQEMLRENYPQELLEAVPDPANNRTSAQRWFLNATRSGESATTKMVSFYQLLCEADPNKVKDGVKKAKSEGKPNVKIVRKDKPKTVDRRQQTTVPIVENRVSEAIKTTNLPPAIEMLVRSLPPEGSSLPVWRRKQWLRMAEEVLVFMYPDEDQEQEEYDVEE